MAHQGQILRSEYWYRIASVCAVILQDIRRRKLTYAARVVEVGVDTRTPLESTVGRAVET